MLALNNICRLIVFIQGLFIYGLSHASLLAEPESLSMFFSVTELTESHETAYQFVLSCGANVIMFDNSTVCALDGTEIRSCKNVNSGGAMEVSSFRYLSSPGGGLHIKITEPDNIHLRFGDSSGFYGSSFDINIKFADAIYHSDKQYINPRISKFTGYVNKAHTRSANGVITRSADVVKLMLLRPSTARIKRDCPIELLTY